MSIPPPHSPKQALRRQMRRLAREAARDSAAVRSSLDQWLTEHPGPQVIAVFFPLPDEPDLTEVVMRHHQRRWVYPKVEGEELRFQMVTNPVTDLIPGAFGIPEPSPTLACIEVGGIDAFICPGLAFDASGGRLGRGKGYYDRTLANARPDAWKIGVCFPDQFVESTYPDAHDVRMDLILS